MDSAHAELLASEAWRNICDTFLLTVLPLAAAAQGKWGLSLPQWVRRQLSERLARLLWHISLLLCSFSLGPLCCHVSSVNVKKKKNNERVVNTPLRFASNKLCCWFFSLPKNLHLSQDAPFNVLAVALAGGNIWMSEPFSHLKLMWHSSPFLLAWRHYIC